MIFCAGLANQQYHAFTDDHEDDIPTIELTLSGAEVKRFPRETILLLLDIQLNDGGTIYRVNFQNKQFITTKDFTLISSLRGCRDVSFTGCGFEDLSQIASLNQMPALVAVILDNCGLRDSDLNVFLQLRKIKWLFLSNNSITDEAIPILSQMTWLDCLGTKGTGLTPAGIIRLKKALPSVRINE